LILTTVPISRHIGAHSDISSASVLAPLAIASVARS
jgi:hypothetical protein